MSNKPDQRRWYVYRQRVAFYETDAMGVVHHANHVRYFENARLEWMRDAGLIDLHHPYGSFVFAVHEQSSRYLKTLKFDEEIEIRLQAKLEGARIRFQYVIWSSLQNAIVATGATALVPVTAGDLKPARLPREAREVFARSPWDEP